MPSRDPDSTQPPPSSVDEIYAKFLKRRESGETVDIEALCSLHPVDGATLRRLHALHGLKSGIIELDSVAGMFKKSGPKGNGQGGGGQGKATGEKNRPDLPGQDLPAQILFSRRYSLREEVAQGGMAVIIRVWDEDVKRQLAMKVMLPRETAPGDTPPVDEQYDQKLLARFLDEAQITGQLDHPGILPVHDVGIDKTGRGFFTMPLVRGRSLGAIYQLARDEKEGWSQTRVLGVMVRVCEALAYAHSKGVIHRDLKPANIMVGRFGETYVMDWGLAKVLGRTETHDQPPATDLPLSVSSVQTNRREQAQSDPQSPFVTIDGTVMGTPAYMAPEQAEGRVEELDQRSDVYAVGGMLYELFTGQMPYVKPGSQISAHTVLGLVIQGPPPPISSIRKGVQPELTAICEKAMARDPAHRYPGMLELADDLRAYLEGHVVGAFEKGLFAEVRKWISRNKGISAALAGILFVLLAATFGYAWLQKQARDDALRQGYVANIIAADVSLRTNETKEAKRRLAACDESLYGWEWRHLFLKSDSSQIVLPHEAGVYCVAYSPDGRWILTGSMDGIVQLWNARSSSAQSIRALAGHKTGVNAVAFSADSARMTTGSAGGIIQLWKTDTGEILHQLSGHDQSVTSVAFHPNGKRIASASRDRTVRLWDTETGELLQTLSGHEGAVNGVAFNSRGDSMVSCSDDGTIRIWDLESGESRRTLSGHQGEVTCIDFSSDGSRIVSGSKDNTVIIWPVHGDQDPVTLRGSSDPISSVAFSPDGQSVAAGSYDKTIRLWSVDSGDLVVTLWGHDDPVRAVAFSEDGQWIVSGSTDRTARIWSTTRGGAVLALRGPDDYDYIASVVVSSDSQRIVAGSQENGTITIWDGISGTKLTTIPGLDDGINSVAISPDGSRIAAGLEEDATVWVWDSRSGQKVQGPLAGHNASIKSVVFGPDGTRLLSASSDGTIRLWNPASGETVHTFLGHEGAVNSVAFSSDGLRVASGSSDKTIRLWNTRSGGLEHVLTGHEDLVQAVVFSPIASIVASGSVDKTIRLWDADTGELVRTLSGHEGAINDLAFSPLGARLVSGSFDKTLRLWDIHSEEAILTLRGHELPVTSVTFSPDCSTIVSGSFDNTVRIWRAPRPEG